MTKSVKITIALLLLACVIIAAFPLLSVKNSEFGGADGAAEEAILAIDPDYEPWAESILEPPGGETDSLLFCRPRWVPACCASGSDTWQRGKSIKKTKHTAGAKALFGFRPCFSFRKEGKR